MSQETTFKISDWIGKDIAMYAAPPRVHRMAKEEFTLPQQFDLLSSHILSLAKMVDFSVPLESPPSSAEQPAQYFSTAASDPVNQNAIHRLRRLPIPESKFIRKPAAGSCQAWLDGYKSVIYSHLGEGVVTHFPLWVLAY
ncbi:hypothetical protein B0H14DRAFT_2576301 [Mycena olivaceomarginata]|nr:hypothetical protein B0H14DRAFT_2576301 [Mycena olivaceomarginata]